jgi:multidrug efflux system outer membrane protein
VRSGRLGAFAFASIAAALAASPGGAAFARTDLLAAVPDSGPDSSLVPPPVTLPSASAAPVPAVIAIPTPAPANGVAFSGAPGDRAPENLDALGTVTYALAHAPSILAQRATVASFDSTFQQQRASEYPTTSAQLQSQLSKQANASGQFAQFGVTPQSNFSQNTAELAASYNLFNGSALINAQEARKRLRNASLELTREQEQLVATVSSAFFALAEDRGIVALDRGDLAYQQSLLDSARAQEHVGRIAGVDVLRAEVAVARSSSTLVQAQTDEANARESLALEIGAPADTTFDLPDAVPEPPAPTAPPAQLATIAKMNRPEISEARAALDASKLANAAIDDDLRPTLALTGAFGSQVSPTSFVSAQQQIDASNAAALASYNQEKALFPFAAIAPPVLLPPVDRHTPGFWQIQLLSTFSIPLYDYGQRAAAHHAAKAQIDSSLDALYNAYDSVAADVNASMRNLDAASQRLAFSKQSAALATETARIAQLQYKNGLISFTDVTQTQQTALSAQNELVAARVAYVDAFIKLRVALAPPNAASAADLRGL